MTIYRLAVPSRGFVGYFTTESDAHASYHMTFRHTPASEKPPFLVEPVVVHPGPVYVVG